MKKLQFLTFLTSLGWTFMATCSAPMDCSRCHSIWRSMPHWLANYSSWVMSPPATSVRWCLRISRKVSLNYRYSTNMRARHESFGQVWMGIIHSRVQWFLKTILGTCHVVPNCCRTPIPKFHVFMLPLSLGARPQKIRGVTLKWGGKKFSFHIF